MTSTVTSEVGPIVIARDQPGFVQTPEVERVVQRALLYLRADLPVHFQGPAGTGKTTLAMYVAGQLDRPVVLIHGDEEFSTSDLIGGETGYRVKKTVDNFIHSVLKTEEDVRRQWVDNRITVACRHGFTLLYDEFTRSRAEANNVLLAVLAERVLDLPAERGGEEGHLPVHPDFRAIFTSNPREYAGVHRAQDALRNRMVTIGLGHYDRETEIAITQAKSGIPHAEAEKIVDIVRDCRHMGEQGLAPTVRAAIVIAKVLRKAEAYPSSGDECFRETCLDVLGPDIATGHGTGNGREAREVVLELITKHCS